MDLRGQLVSVWLRRRMVVGLALLVALVVLVLRQFAPTVYATEATVRIDVPGVSGADLAQTVSFHAEQLVGIAETPVVLDEVVAHSGLRITTDEARERINVGRTRVPGVLTVAATGPTPQASAALTVAARNALAARVAQDEATVADKQAAPLRKQLAALETELARPAPDTSARTAAGERYAALVQAVTEIETRSAPALLLGPEPAAPVDPVRPTAVRDAALAFLVALILIAEATVIVRAARGRLSESDPAGQVERMSGLPAVELGHSRDPVVALAPLYRARLRGGWRPGEPRADLAGAPTVTVVQLSDGQARDLGLDLAQSAALVGDDVRHVDLGTGARADRVGDEPVIHSVRRPGVDGALLALVRNRPGVVVLAIDTASTGVRQFGSDLDALRAVGVEVAAVLVWLGSFPRRHRTTAEPARLTVEPAVEPAGG